MNVIKAQRESIGLTQLKLSQKLKIARSTVAMWESGRTIPRADKLPALAKILKCNVSDLLTEPKEAVNGQ